MVTGAIVLSFFSVVASLSQSASKLGKYFNASREGRVALERIETLLDSISIQTIDYRIYLKSQPIYLGSKMFVFPIMINFYLI